MPRFFFNVRDGISIPDLEGTELAGIDEAKHEAVRLSGQMLVEDPARFWNGEQWSLDVCDESGLVLLSMMFVATESPALTGSSPHLDGSAGARARSDHDPTS